MGQPNSCWPSEWMKVAMGVSSVSSCISWARRPMRLANSSRVLGMKTMSRSMWPVALWCLPCEIFHEK
jgi:hypothetical protein